MNPPSLLMVSLKKNAVAGILLALVGAVFVLKYSARVTELPSFVATSYFLGYVTLSICLWSLDLKHPNLLNDRMLLLLTTASVVVLAVLLVTLLPEGSRVGRLPALNESIERLAEGHFPWGVSTKTRPSGFPFLFVFALPFHYVGNLGFLEVLGVLLFALSVFKYHRIAGNRWSCLLGLLALPTFYYELIVRSELFFNMALFIFLIVLSERYLDATRVDFSLIALALVFGLCLSTRLITILIFVAYITHKFHNNILNGLLFACISLLMFSLTLVPFLLWDAKTFVLDGPFSVQMSYLPPVVAFLFFLSALLIGWNSPTLRVLFLSLGVLLFGIVLASFLLTTATSNYLSAVIYHGFDIGYLIFSVPFLLLSLEKIISTDGSPT
jgi:hypothetical protein